MRSVALFFAVSFFAVSVRLPTLHARSFWFDEGFSWKLSTFPLSELLARAARDNNPPLYYVLLKGWAAVWGESAVALRGLSIVYGLLTMLGVWLFAREAFGRPNEGDGGNAEEEEPARGRRPPGIGLLAAALVGASVLHVHWAGEVRMYTMGAALVALSSWALLRALRRNSLRSWLLYAALALAFAYTHTYAPFTLASQGVFVAGSLVVGFVKRARARAHARSLASSATAEESPAPRILASSATASPATATTNPATRTIHHAVLAASLVVAGYSPWLPVLLRQRQQVQTVFWVPDVSWNYVGNVLYAVWVAPIDAVNTAAEATAATVFTAALLLSLLWRPKAGEWLTLCLAAGPVLIALAVSYSDTPIFAAHYLIFAHTFMLVALARLYRVPYRLERTILAATVLACMAWIAVEWRWRQDIPHNPGGRAASAHIDAGRASGEPVVVCSPLLYFSVLFHTADRDGWRLFDDGIQPRIHHLGAAAIQADELISAEQLAATPAERVWAVNMQGGGWGTHTVPVPRSWKAVATHRFPEVYRMQGEIVVVEYLTRPPPDGIE